MKRVKPSSSKALKHVHDFKYASIPIDFQEFEDFSIDLIGNAHMCKVMQVIVTLFHLSSESKKLRWSQASFMQSYLQCTKTCFLGHRRNQTTGDSFYAYSSKPLLVSTQSKSSP